MARQWSCHDRDSPSPLFPRSHSPTAWLCGASPTPRKLRKCWLRCKSQTVLRSPPLSAQLRERLMQEHNSCPMQPLARGSCREEAELQPPRPGQTKLLCNRQRGPLPTAVLVFSETLISQRQHALPFLSIPCSPMSLGGTPHPRGAQNRAELDLSVLPCPGPSSSSLLWRSWLSPPWENAHTSAKLQSAPTT